MFGIDTSRLAISVFSANTNLSRSLQRLSTNKKLAGDAPSNVARANNYKKHISIMGVALENLAETKEAFGVASEANDSVVGILHKMRELAVRSASSEISDAERVEMHRYEFTDLRDSIDDIANRTQFKDTVLTHGSWITAAGKEVWVGPDPLDTFTVTMGLGVDYDLNLDALSLNGAAINDQTVASSAVTSIDTALDTVLGFGNSLNTAMNTIDDFVNIKEVTRNNLEAARTVIEDIDLAREMVAYTKASVIQQASISMLAQGNLASQNMLALFA